MAECDGGIRELDCSVCINTRRRNRAGDENGQRRYAAAGTNVGRKRVVFSAGAQDTPSRGAQRLRIASRLMVATAHTGASERGLVEVLDRTVTG